MSFSILRPLYPSPTRSGNSLVAGQLTTATSTAAVALVGTALNGGTHMCMFDIQGGNVWCTVDGQTPSSTKGHLLSVGQAYTWSAGMMNAAKVIATTTTNATIWISELQD